MFSSFTMSVIPTPIILVPSSENPPITDHSITTSNTNPCVIHHSDNPSTALVTYLLTGDNYGSWSHTVTMALHVKNKLGFVDGSLTSLKKKEDILKWQHCNDLVASWILNSNSTEIRPSILYAETEAHNWSYLKDCSLNQVLLKYINWNIQFLPLNKKACVSLFISVNSNLFGMNSIILLLSIHVSEVMLKAFLIA